jgi:DNA invertase Pin-like site-specific DNA recombinase
LWFSCRTGKRKHWRHGFARLAAKARGVAFGRPKKMRPDQHELARELVREGKSISSVARTFDVHPATIYRVIEG